jgi:transposase
MDEKIEAFREEVLRWRGTRRAKVLYFDGTGLCLLAKRLERGRFARPWERSAGGVVSLTLSELALFPRRQ